MRRRLRNATGYNSIEPPRERPVRTLRVLATFCLGCLLPLAAIFCLDLVPAPEKVERGEPNVTTSIQVENGVRTMTKTWWYESPDGKCSYQVVSKFIEQNGEWIPAPR